MTRPLVLASLVALAGAWLGIGAARRARRGRSGATVSVASPNWLRLPPDRHTQAHWAAEAKRRAQQCPRLVHAGCALAPPVPGCGAFEAVLVAGRRVGTRLVWFPNGVDLGALSLEPLDILLDANGRSFDSPDGVGAVIHALYYGSPVTLTVIRSGRLVSIRYRSKRRSDLRTTAQRHSSASEDDTRVRLLATIEGRAGRRRAVLETAGHAKVYEVGDRVAVPGTRLAAVEEDRVMLVSRVEGCIVVGYSGERRVVTSARKPVRRISPNVRCVDAATYHDHWSSSAYGEARVWPVFREGHAIGFKASVRGLKALGFEPGDIVIRVDGIPATSPDTMLAVYAKAKRQNFVSVTVLRRRRELTYVYGWGDVPYGSSNE